jgi:hypothetical protein
MTDDWLAAERERFGRTPTEDDINQGYDMYLAAVLAARQAEKDRLRPPD